MAGGGEWMGAGWAPAGRGGLGGRAVKHGGQFSFSQLDFVNSCRIRQLAGGDYRAFVSRTACSDFAVELNCMSLCM
jgi:hypothetical protein